MCKTYDAIYKLSQHVESDILICYLKDLKAEGQLFKCNCEFDENKCYPKIITLKEAKIYCPKSGESKNYKWINIPSAQIQAFAFKCCEQ